MKTKYFILILLLISQSSCHKWLDKKSNIADVTPTTLADYQAILDNDASLNTGTPSLGLICSDNYYVSSTTWQARSAIERNSYTWASEVYEGTNPIDWSQPYEIIESANIVLDGISAIPITNANQSQWNNIKGSALFTRANSFYHLAQVFAPPYIAATADTDLGIPLRTTSDINVLSTRASVKETYEKVLSDLKEAETLLPSVAAYQTRPSKLSTYALLAKTYLHMGNFAKVFEYADKALAIYNPLIDYNSLSTTASLPFNTYPNNSEIIYYNTGIFYGILVNTSMIIDSTLYQSYANNDLRKVIFYRISNNNPLFKGAYTGKNNSIFSGLAVNELYLLRAEANARIGNTANAMADLNTLLQKRWKTGTFVPLTAANADDALNKILVERRKELPLTGNIRWEDLRRLNQDSRFAKTITRILNGQTYTLAPNDKRYTLPIPDNEIRLSGIQQNIR